MSQVKYLAIFETGPTIIKVSDTHNRHLGAEEPDYLCAQSPLLTSTTFPENIPDDTLQKKSQTLKLFFNTITIIKIWKLKGLIGLALRLAH